MTQTLVRWDAVQMERWYSTPMLSSMIDHRHDLHVAFAAGESSSTKKNSWPRDPFVSQKLGLIVVEPSSSFSRTV